MLIYRLTTKKFFILIINVKISVENKKSAYYNSYTGNPELKIKYTIGIVAPAVSESERFLD